jgi:hypothetical protein
MPKLLIKNTNSYAGTRLRLLLEAETTTQEHAHSSGDDARPLEVPNDYSKTPTKSYAELTVEGLLKRILLKELLVLMRENTGERTTQAERLLKNKLILMQNNTVETTPSRRLLRTYLFFCRTTQLRGPLEAQMTAQESIVLMQNDMGGTRARTLLRTLDSCGKNS